MYLFSCLKALIKKMKVLSMNPSLLYKFSFKVAQSSRKVHDFSKLDELSSNLDCIRNHNFYFHRFTVFFIIIKNLES